MANSGKYLVLGLVVLAVIAGVASWWYHYAGLHQANRFWGSPAAGLIAQPSQVTAYDVVKQTESQNASARSLDLRSPWTAVNPRDVTEARGMVHLRHALMNNRSYEWDEQPAADPDWRWCLEFFNDDAQTLVLFNEEFTVIGNSSPTDDSLRMLSCRPMTAALREYFSSLGLLEKK